MAEARGHNWTLMQRGHFRSNRKWCCDTCGRWFTGENPPEGVCSLSRVHKERTYTWDDIDKALMPTLKLFGVATLEANEVADKLREALESTPKK